VVLDEREVALDGLQLESGWSREKQRDHALERGARVRVAELLVEQQPPRVETRRFQVLKHRVQPLDVGLGQDAGARHGDPELEAFQPRRSLPFILEQAHLKLERVDADCFLVELKAAAIDVVVEAALARGARVVLAANDVLAAQGQGDLDEMLLEMAKFSL